MEERVNEGRTKGRKHSPETRAKITALKKGRKGPKRSPETRAKISASRKGRKFPNISASQTGRKKSPARQDECIEEKRSQPNDERLAKQLSNPMTAAY
jgi:hypothetical protein